MNPSFDVTVLEFVIVRDDERAIASALRFGRIFDASADAKIRGFIAVIDTYPVPPPPRRLQADRDSSISSSLAEEAAQDVRYMEPPVISKLYCIVGFAPYV